MCHETDESTKNDCKLVGSIPGMLDKTSPSPWFCIREHTGPRPEKNKIIIKIPTTNQHILTKTNNIPKLWIKLVAYKKSN